MPVPSVLTDLTAVASGNFPVGGDAVFPDLDNYLRAHASFIKQNYDTLSAKANTSALTAYATLSALASTSTTTEGAGLSGFSWSLNYAANTIAWAAMTARYSILKYIPVAQWAAIFAGTTTYDATADIASALAAEKLITMPHGTIRGEWDFSNVRGKIVRGAGRDVTTLANVDNTAVFTLNNAASDCKNNHFADFKIVNRDEATYTTCDGFLISNGSTTNEKDFNTWERVDVVDCRYGWNVTGRMIWTTWADCHALSCVDGWHIDTTQNVSELTWITCRSGANTGYGIYANKASGDPFFGWKLIGCTLEKNALNGLRVSGAASGISGFTILGGHYEENTTTVAASETAPRKANIFIDAVQCVGFNIIGANLLGTPLATALDWGVYITSTTCAGVISPCRAGTFTLGFAQVSAGVVIVAPQDGGSTAISGAGAFTMSRELTGSFTATLTGCTTSPTGDATYVAQVHQVTISFPTITATSNTTACTVTGIPAALRPTTSKDVVARSADATAGTKVVRGVIDSSGVLTLYTDGATGVFANSGTKGIASCSITYQVD